MCQANCLSLMIFALGLVSQFHRYLLWKKGLKWKSSRKFVWSSIICACCCMHQVYGTTIVTLQPENAWTPIWGNLSSYSSILRPRTRVLASAGVCSAACTLKVSTEFCGNFHNIQSHQVSCTPLLLPTHLCCLGAYTRTQLTPITLTMCSLSLSTIGNNSK